MFPEILQKKTIGKWNSKLIFISSLQSKFQRAEVLIKQAYKDVFIANTAYDCVTVVSKDVGLLAVVTALVPKNLCFRKSGRERDETADGLYSKHYFK